MREALVDVLVDDVRLVQDQVALDEDGHLVVRVHHAMSSGLAKRSTSRISKSMPFSNSTKRQRCEKGQWFPNKAPSWRRAPESRSINSGAPRGGGCAKRQTLGPGRIPLRVPSPAWRLGDADYFMSFQKRRSRRQAKHGQQRQQQHPHAQTRVRVPVQARPSILQETDQVMPTALSYGSGRQLAGRWFARNP